TRETSRWCGRPTGDEAFRHPGGGSAGRAAALLELAREGERLVEPSALADEPSALVPRLRDDLCGGVVDEARVGEALLEHRDVLLDLLQPALNALALLVGLDEPAEPDEHLHVTRHADHGARRARAAGLRHGEGPLRANQELDEPRFADEELPHRSVRRPQ